MQGDKTPLIDPASIPAWIPDDVRTELTDPARAHMRHHTAGTYAGGCRGPLCALFNSKRHRAMYEAKRARQGKKPTMRNATVFWHRIMEPVIQWYEPLSRQSLERSEAEELLQEIA